MEQPEVGVVIPAYHMEDFVGAAIASVLSQDVAVQLVVVDDASPDATELRARAAIDGVATAAVVANDRLKGVCGARNAGLQRLRTPWVLFLDADDLLLPGALAALLMARRTGCSAVLGAFCTVDEQGSPMDGSWAGQQAEGFRRLGEPQVLTASQLARVNVMPPPGGQLLSVDALRAVGGFDEGPLAQGWSEDAELLARLAAVGQISRCEAEVLAYRQRGGSLSTRPGWRRQVARSRRITVRRARRRDRPGLGLAFAARYGGLGAARVVEGLRRGRPKMLANGLANLALAASFLLLGVTYLAWPSWRPTWSLEAGR